MGVLGRYYTALAAKDWRTIAACYHDEAHFGGPVFPDLDADQVRAMWKMLLTSGTDLRITFKVQREDADGGMAQCEAFYTFSRTGRKVHNRIASEFTFRNGLIHGQRSFRLLAVEPAGTGTRRLAFGLDTGGARQSEAAGRTIPRKVDALNAAERQDLGNLGGERLSWRPQRSPPGASR